MRSDFYTKAVLTVIAAALVALVIQNGIRTSKAQPDQLTKIQICDDRGRLICATVSGGMEGGGRYPITTDRLAVELPHTN